MSIAPELIYLLLAIMFVPFAFGALIGGFIVCWVSEGLARFHWADVLAQLVMFALALGVNMGAALRQPSSVEYNVLGYQGIMGFAFSALYYIIKALARRRRPMR